MDVIELTRRLVAIDSVNPALVPGGAGEGYGVGVGPKRPSFIRAVSIALAVASPIAIPAAFDPGGLSGRAAM